MRRLTAAVFLIIAIPAFAQNAEDAGNVEVEIRLPFLPADGAIRPVDPIRPLLPVDPGSGVIIEGEFMGHGVVADTRPGPEGDREMALWPDVDELLDDLPGTAKIRRGLLRYRGSRESAERLRRRIEAVRGALGQTVRIRVAVGPVGEEPWLDIEGKVRTGALLREDARVERSFPAGTDLEARYAAAEFQRLLLGSALAASATPIGRERFLLRLSFVHVRLHPEKRFEGGGTSIVAPETTIAVGAFSIPLKPGTSRTLRCDGVSLVVSVEPITTPEARAGIRAIRTDALWPLFEGVRIPTPGPERLGFAPGTREIPARILERTGLTAMEVEPDILVVEGDEEALAKLDRELNEWGAREFPTIRVRGATGDLVVAGGSSGYLATGRMLPVAHSVETSSLSGYIREAPSVTWILAGKATVISFPEPGLLRLHSVSGEILRSEERRIRFPLAEAMGRREVDLPRTELRVETEALATDLPLDGTQRDGLSAREEGK